MFTLIHIANLIQMIPSNNVQRDRFAMVRFQPNDCPSFYVGYFLLSLFQMSIDGVFFFLSAIQNHWVTTTGNYYDLIEKYTRFVYFSPLIFFFSQFHQSPKANDNEMMKILFCFYGMNVNCIV